MGRFPRKKKDRRMETTVNSLEFAKKLKKRLKELHAEKQRAQKKFQADLATWKKALDRWVISNVHDHIVRIGVKEIQDNPMHYGDSPGFDTKRFFRGAPKPPAYPNSSCIREIQKTLRLLGLTGQKMLRVSPSDIERWFGEVDGDEE